MANGYKTGGRQKGSLNKITTTAKDAISCAADDLGGKERLVAWVKEDPSNEKVFWGTIYPKLLPLQLTGDGENPLEIINKIEIEIVDSQTAST
jgi:hypothetical protein